MLSINKLDRSLVLVYGGQYGSEGKGDVCAHYARDYHKTALRLSEQGLTTEIVACRVGGTNAGHTFLDKDFNERVVRTLPVASFIIPGCVSVLGAGALLDLSILVEEIEALNGMWGHSNQPILVDRHATFITEEDKHYEAFLTGRIGSTGKGVGAAQSRKVMRTSVAAENPNIQDKLTDLFGGQVQVVDTTAYLNSSPDVDHFVHLVEGTQGYLLSLDVGGYYPFCTSRNCGPEAIMSQLGINPRSYRANQIIGVFRTFPIRVGGNSGDLPGEVTWEEMEQITEGVVKADNPEITTVTKKPRRIARRDQEMTAKTIRDTRPDEVALTFLDYVRPEECRFVQDDAEMMEKIRDGSLDIVELPIGIIEEVSKFEGENGVYVGMISVGQHLTIKL